MDTTTNTTSSTTATGRGGTRTRRPAQAPGGLPPDFDAEVWTRQTCERSGVTFAVTDPVALSKLRVLTRPES